MSFARKLVMIGTLSAALPVLILTGIVWYQSNRSNQTTVEGVKALAEGDLKHIAEGLVRMCKGADAVLQTKLDSDLRVAKHQLKILGGFALSSRSVISWTVKNQFTQKESTVSLPAPTVGGTPIPQERSFESPVHFVDEVSQLTGAKVTLFQRMNGDGDMLRAATSVKTAKGERAIGSYIPVVEPGGQKNEILAQILAGKEYRGRGFVVDQWYATRYFPLRDASGEVAGMLFIGVPLQLATESVRQAMLDTRIFETGYAYAIYGSGSVQGTYAVSQNGNRDGENIWDAKDAAGRLFIQEICQSAKKAVPGSILEIRYPWKASDGREQEKIAYYSYYEPWDWVIGSSAPIEEFQATSVAVASVNRETILWAVVTGLLGALLAIGVWIITGQRAERRIRQFICALRESASQVTAGANEVANTSQYLANGTTQNADSTQRVVSTLGLLEQTVETNHEQSSEARTLAGSSNTRIADIQVMVTELTEGMESLNRSSTQLAAIVQLIDEIAFQTNILALNAAIEAARVGDAGVGFAVVAGEVRALAHRCASAAEESSQNIEASVSLAGRARQQSLTVADHLRFTLSDIQSLSKANGTLANSSEQQRSALGEITGSVQKLDELIQSTAAAAEQSASAAEELGAQSEALRGLAMEISQFFLADAGTAGGSACAGQELMGTAG